jgi:hypothetical protein
MGSKKTTVPGPDPAQVAYNSYMLEHQKQLDAQAQAQADSASAATAATKATGAAGYNAFRQNILNQFNSGLIDQTQAQQQLTDYEAKFSLGTGYTLNDINSLSAAATAAQPGKLDLLAGQTYKDILGRNATQAEIANFENLSKTGQYKLTDLVNSIKSGTEYQNKFNDNYLSSYYDTMYGKQTTTTDASGITLKTGQRTFKYDSTWDPTYAGNLATDTGINVPTVSGGSFTGTPAEIEAFQQAQRQKRDFMYNAGLTNLQGQIDKDVQKIKNEGSREVQRISSNTQVLSNLTQGFW